MANSELAGWNGRRGDFSTRWSRGCGTAMLPNYLHLREAANFPSSSEKSIHP
jgi:hypothetical protein